MWRYVGDPLQWKTFWPGLEDVRRVDDDTGTLGTYQLAFKSFLPYTLTLVAEVKSAFPPRQMVLVTRGELKGTAILDVRSLDESTSRTRLTWETETTLAWMNAASPLLRGLFEWNHDFLMRKAGDGLAERLGAQVTHREATGTPLVRALVPVGLLLASLSMVRLVARKLRRSRA